MYFCEYCNFIDKANLDTTDLFNLIFGASIHDYDHSGTNNVYLINNLDDLALKYNDKSPLENHHIS